METKTNFDEEMTDYITQDMIVYSLNKHKPEELMNAILKMIYYNENYPNNNTVILKENDKGKIQGVNKLLISKNGEWIEEEIKIITYKMQRKSLDTILSRIIPKPKDLEIKKFFEFITYYYYSYKILIEEGINL